MKLEGSWSGRVLQEAVQDELADPLGAVGVVGGGADVHVVPMGHPLDPLHLLLARLDAASLVLHKIDLVVRHGIVAVHLVHEARLGEGAA